MIKRNLFIIKYSEEYKKFWINFTINSKSASGYTLSSQQIPYTKSRLVVGAYDILV